MKSLVRQFYLNNKIYIYILLGCMIIGIIMDIWGEYKVRSKPLSPLTSTLDTMIPKGFVLFPIEIENFEKLDSILGQYGVVDIYTKANSRKSRKIANKVKIFRAPQNPNQFAVLTPENKTQLFVSNPGPYYIFVQNPKSRGTKFGVSKKRKGFRIQIMEWGNDKNI